MRKPKNPLTKLRKPKNPLTKYSREIDKAFSGGRTPKDMKAFEKLMGRIAKDKVVQKELEKFYNHKW